MLVIACGWSAVGVYAGLRLKSGTTTKIAGRVGGAARGGAGSAGRSILDKRRYPKAGQDASSRASAQRPIGPLGPLDPSAHSPLHGSGHFMAPHA